MTELSSRHLLGLKGLSYDDIALVLDVASAFREVIERPIRTVPTLRGWTVANLFFESSTRTRISFELAEKRLSADVVNLSAPASSASKGETLKDTARNIEAMRIDAVVVRHAASGVPHFLADAVDCTVISAGDGQHEHPTQGLLDLYTLHEQLGDLEGKRIVIVGDVRHSRVARSGIWGMTTMGASVAVCAPPTLLPSDLDAFPVDVYNNVDEAIEGADVIYTLRIQLERQQGALFPSIREYMAMYGINRSRLERARPGCLIMHPGPINRGWELDGDVADDPQSVILPQVTNGVAVRMAVLYLTAGRGTSALQKIGEPRGLGSEI